MKENPNNYDAWFDYLRLCESESTIEATREVYERAVANVPPAPDKRLWRRYIYLWIYYAVFEELVAEVSLGFATLKMKDRCTIPIHAYIYIDIYI